MDFEIMQLFERFATMVSKNKIFMELLLEFSIKWAQPYEDINEFNVMLTEAENEFRVLKQKCLRNYKSCVFYGRTSTGKSSLINKIFGEDLLPTGFGSTSNRFVEIKESASLENFILMKNDDGTIAKEEFNCLKIISKTMPKKNLSTPLKVFYSKENFILLKNNFAIFDTPGLGKGVFEEETMVLCNEADLVIIVLSCLSELGSMEKNILLNYKNNFSHFNVIVVYNFFDVIHSRSDFDEICQMQEKQAENFLLNEIKINEFNRQKNNIFFLSSLEKPDSDSTDDSREKFEKRKKRMDMFKLRIIEEAMESCYSRKMNMLKISECIFEELFSRCNNTFTNFMTEISNLVERVKSEMGSMENLSELNKKINTEIDASFKLIVECIVKNGKNAVDTKNKAKCLSLEKLINETVENEIIKLKEKVTEFIMSTESTEFCKNVLTEIYLNKYFNYKSNIKKEDDMDIVDNILKSKKTDHIMSGLKTGIDGCLGAAAVASGGISVGVTAAMEAAAGVTSLITGKDISMSRLLNFIKKPFHFIWDKEEDNIRKHFVSIKETLKDCAINLSEKIESDIIQITDPLCDKFNDIKQFYEDSKIDISNFREKSFIYI